MVKIMLVEDDKSLREIYGARLLAEGYDIVSAGDGEEALAIALKEKPGLIISDVMMPKISGFDMLDILRSSAETRNVKVIMMTALSSDDQRQRGESLGADRYLVKSQVGIEDVVRVVHEVLEDSENGAEGSAPAPVAQDTANAEEKPADSASQTNEESQQPAQENPAPAEESPANTQEQQQPEAPAEEAPAPEQPAQAEPSQPSESQAGPQGQSAESAEPPQDNTENSEAAPAAETSKTPEPTSQNNESGESSDTSANPTLATPNSPNSRTTIQPINDPNKNNVDINALLDKEAAKEAGYDPNNPPQAATADQERETVEEQINQFANTSQETPSEQSAPENENNAPSADATTEAPAQENTAPDAQASDQSAAATDGNNSGDTPPQAPPRPPVAL